MQERVSAAEMLRFCQKDARYCFVALCFDINLSIEQQDAIIDLLSSYSDHILVYKNSDTEFWILYSADSNVKMRRLCIDIAAYTNQYMQKNYNIQGDWLIGPSVGSYDELERSSANIQILRRFRYIERSERLYFWDDYDRSRDKSCTDVKEQYDILMNQQSGDAAIKILKEYINSLEEAVCECWFEKEKTIVSWILVLSWIYNVYQKMGIEKSPMGEMIESTTNQIYRSTGNTEMKQAVNSIVYFLETEYKKTGEDYRKRQARLALEYLEKHYKNSNLTLMEVCDELSMSKSYFCSVFKQYTGKTFVEALNERRMQEAAHLLRTTSLKTREIAEQCGYNETGYFGALFKKIYSMTPKEYRQQYKNE